MMPEEGFDPGMDEESIPWDVDNSSPEEIEEDDDE